MDPHFSRTALADEDMSRLVSEAYQYFAHEGIALETVFNDKRYFYGAVLHSHHNYRTIFKVPSQTLIQVEHSRAPTHLLRPDNPGEPMFGTPSISSFYEQPTASTTQPIFRTANSFGGPFSSTPRQHNNLPSSNHHDNPSAISLEHLHHMDSFPTHYRSRDSPAPSDMSYVPMMTVCDPFPGALLDATKNLNPTTDSRYPPTLGIPPTVNIPRLPPQASETPPLDLFSYNNEHTGNSQAVHPTNVHRVALLDYTENLHGQHNAPYESTPRLPAPYSLEVNTQATVQSLSRHQRYKARRCPANNWACKALDEGLGRWQSKKKFVEHFVKDHAHLGEDRVLYCEFGCGFTDDKGGVKMGRHVWDQHCL